MKILFGTHAVPFMKPGGLLSQILNTKRSLEEKGIVVALFNGWEPLDVKRYDLFHLFRADLHTYFLGKTMKEEGIKIVLSPIFYSQHSPRILSSIYRFGRILRKLKTLNPGHVLVSELCRMADRNLPNTRSEALLLERGLGIPKSKIRVIPNGVEERFYHGDPSFFKKTYGLENFILSVGQFGSGRKNTLNLLRALKKIDHPAVLMGPVMKSSYSDQCLREAQKNKNLLLLPEVEASSPLLESAYAACDVFVLPSLFETPGIAALEAGLAGAKVVITKQGGTKEYFEDYAEYVNPYSIPSIHFGILNALEKEKSDFLKKHIHKNFLWERVARETILVYEELV